MHKRRFAVSALLVLAITGCSAGQPAAPAPPTPAPVPLERELASVVEDPVHGMASLSVLAVRGGQVQYQGAFGRRFIHPSDRALDKGANPQTLYRIASVSKFVTMLGVMRLVEEGRLGLDRDVGDYLGYPLRNPDFPAQPVTLRMLLSHTSSLRDDAGYSWGAGVSLRSAMQGKAGVWDGRRVPGAYFAYSNLNWGVIGTVMEAATGERFDLLMQRLVLQPLAIKGGYNVAALGETERGNLATLYRKRPADGGPWNPAGPWFAQADDFSVQMPAAPAGLDQYRPGSNGTLFSPTGGLRVSAADLGTLMLMLLDGGRHQGKAFLTAQSMAAIFSTQWRYNPAAPNGDTHGGLFAHWGLGTQHFEDSAKAKSSLVEGGGYPASGHLGEAWGLLSVFALNFAERSGVVVLIGGTASDPARTPGTYSALTRQEELILTALHRHVLRQ